jgi:hypothetical protein
MNRPGFRYQARPFRFFPALGVCGRRQRGLSPAAEVRTRFAREIACSHPMRMANAKILGHCSGMSRIFVPSDGPSTWQRFLAEPERQWVTGYSARTVAHSWEAQATWPSEIAMIIEQGVGQTDLLLAIPEHKTPLPGGQRESQSDVFALGRHRDGLIACTIEAKVNEAFGPTVADQMNNASPGKLTRFEFLCGSLGISNCPDDIHYQLLHRTVSALIEADRFATKYAAMIVHSFSPERRWFGAFERFVSLLGGTAVVGAPINIETPGGYRLMLGWACGDPIHLIA